MEKFTVFYVILPLLVAYLAIQYRFVWLMLLKKVTVPEMEQKEIVIGVLSARDHFQHRQTIRKTWQRAVINNDSLSDRVEVKFVVGQRACQIPIADRYDPYTCQLYNMSIPDVLEDILAVTEHQVAETKTTKWNYALQTLPFKVHHPVVLGKLGVHVDSLQHKLAIRLLDAVTQTEIVSTVFSKETPGVLLEGFRYKAVEPYLLPQGFDGLIVAERMSSGTQELPVTTRDVTMTLSGASGVIEFLEPRLEPTHEGHYSDPRAAGANRLPIASFIYSVHDIDKLGMFIANRTSRETEWRDLMQQHQEELESEAAHHGDMLLVDIVDVYRNVPLKLVRFYQWLSSEREFELAMKTDDDCYVDVEALLLRRDAAYKQHSGDKLWWGRFRQSWAVEHYGKWAELQYPSIAYPTFACGSGSLVSADIVSWIAQNADMLHMFQGEDVSLGVWLAALSVRMLEDPMFQCEKQCISDMVTMPDLSPPELQQVWNDRLACGDPCGCS